jgi:small subunit ribosomal protein S20
MANHKSAKKRARQSLVRRARNRDVTTRTRTIVKRVHDAIAKGDGTAARAELGVAERALRKAGSKGVLPQSRVDRSVSRLARAVHKLG